jgi:plastocyanin
MSRRIGGALGALLLAGLCGCGTPEAKRSEVLPQAHRDQVNGATISGKVLFSGAAPVNPIIDMSSNPTCERQHGPRAAEIAVVNPNHTLKNTFVWIAAGLPAARWDALTVPARLDQNGCMYEPHVQGVMTGQPIEIYNSDPVNHNVHAESKVNAAWNESQPPRAEIKRKSFAEQEVLIPVSCSVHPWMRSYIGVVAHPFFAVTGADGTFSLTGVPPGTYTIEAVHEKFGRQRQQIIVAPKQSAILDFTYGS